MKTIEALIDGRVGVGELKLRGSENFPEVYIMLNTRTLINLVEQLLQSNFGNLVANYFNGAHSCVIQRISITNLLHILRSMKTK